MAREIVVTFYHQQFHGFERRVDVSHLRFKLFFIELAEDLSRFGIRLSRHDEMGRTVDIRSHADLLSAVRLSSAADGIFDLCLGQIIERSPNCDLLEDLKRGVNRVAFAASSLPLALEHRNACLDCGGGC
jgi:hypothetical protein